MRHAPAMLEPLLDDENIGREARVSAKDHDALRLWLRLLSLSNDIETEIRKRLRTRFDITLARFDYLAQLHRHPAGVRMNALSRFLMVTGGNVTGVTDELEKDGLVAREVEPDDRRSYRVRLTAKGRRVFEKIAREHESWVVELLGGLDGPDRELVYTLLGQLRVHLSTLQVAGAGGKQK